MIPFLSFSTLATGRLLYQHSQHAGNFADVVKHSILIALFNRMRQKASPFTYVETHSGAGIYALKAQESQERPPEFERGISLVLSKKSNGSSLAPPAIQQLLEMVSVQDDDSTIIYPGSPWIASKLCRPVDDLFLCEAMQGPHDDLCHNLQSKTISSRIHVSLADGYKQIVQKQYNGQWKNRSLVFVDPPYQFGSDTQQVVGLVKSLQRYKSTARIAIWYPVRTNDEPSIERTRQMHKQILGVTQATSSVLAVELDTPSNNDVGTGMLMVQPPFGIQEDLQEILPQLRQLLTTASETPPEAKVEWLREV